MNALAQVVYSLARKQGVDEANMASLSQTEQAVLSEALLARRLDASGPADEWPSPVAYARGLEAAGPADEWPSPVPYTL